MNRFNYNNTISKILIGGRNRLNPYNIGVYKNITINSYLEIDNFCL